MKTDAARRKRWIGILVAGFATIGIAYGIYWLTDLRYLETTDDAYVAGNVVRVTPQVSGTVVSIGADDTQLVHEGEPLVTLDPSDAKVALEQSEAQLGKAVREVRGLYATATQLEALVEAQRIALAKAEADLARRERLSATGAISAEERQHARDAMVAAKAALAEAQHHATAVRARVDRTSLRDHPEVRAAAARVRDAYLMYARTVVAAPVSGLVAKRAVQVGQRVGPGAPLMAVVPLEQVWVDANFKESQLARMRIGQAAEVVADVYGDSVVYHGRIAGLGAGTGSAFAVLPAQNATGNWIKIVQRVPVRIALDPRELRAHPLQIGLSMNVSVDTADLNGVSPPAERPALPAYQTHVFDDLDRAADQRVERIIAENGAGATRVASAARGRVM